MTVRIVTTIDTPSLVAGRLASDEAQRIITYILSRRRAELSMTHECLRAKILRKRRRVAFARGARGRSFALKNRRP